MEQVTQKRHNTAETSKEAFISLSNEGRLIDQKKIIYEAIREQQPINSRQLSILTRQERSSVCRSLYDLQNEITPAIKVCFLKRCPITGRKVKWYSLIDWQPETQLRLL